MNSDPSKEAPKQPLIATEPPNVPRGTQDQPANRGGGGSPAGLAAAPAPIHPRGKFLGKEVVEDDGEDASETGKRGMSEEHKAKMAAGRARALAKKRTKAAKKILPRKEPVAPLPGSIAPEIDYDKLAEAMVRAQERRAEARPSVQTEANANAGHQWQQETRGDSASNQVTQVIPFDPNRVVPSNNPVARILSQLTYPPDKEGQVVAMIAANMAPSWDGNNMGIDDRAYAPLQERQVLEHMKEYVLTLRPELPKVRLEPKYKLYGERVVGS